jgi:type II secretory pathway component PulJ
VLSGVAVDGYLQGATVFLDVNNNGILDTGEPSALTDASGRFTLDYSQVTTSISGLKMVVTGGIDTDTGYAFTGRLSAAADKTAGQVISPLTSLVDAVIAQGLAADTAAAKVLVANALGLTVADLASDPVAALVNQPAIYRTAIELQRAVQLLATMNAEAGESSHHAQERVMKAFAVALKAQNSSVSVSQLVAALNLNNRAGALQLTHAVHDGVTTALSHGGHTSAKAVLKGLDQVRVRMESDHDDDIDKAAGKLDTERGLTTSTPFKNLVQPGSSVTEVTAMTTLYSRPSTVIAQPTNTAGRLLASNCFQCHGTGGLGGFDSIRGDASEVKEYLSKSASGDIMAAHAQGYTSAQLDAIIKYLNQ